MCAVKPTKPDTHSETYQADFILVVDDEAQVRRLLSKILEMDGYEVLESTDGQEALEVVSRETVSAVLIDLVMPNMGGLELLEKIHEIDAHLPVIVVSSKNDVDDAVACIRAGASDYIAKPFKVTQIRQAVRTALQKTQTMRRKEALSAMNRISTQDSLAGYEILDTIGEGTMGTVLLAEREEDGQRNRYAIKVLKVVSLDQRKQDVIVERFMREAKVLAQLDHPNIVKFVEYGLAYDGTVPYFVMEYLEGKSLRQYIREIPLDLRTKVTIIRDIASALQVIHDKDLCHRDIKPDNIILTNQMQAILTDFGVVRVPESDLTQTAQFIGSPAYLSPEGYRYGKTDQRSDIFALGIVAYELLLGRKPFVGENISELSRRILRAHPLEPQKLQPEFPRQLQAILARMLKKDPDERYPQTAELVQALDGFLETYDEAAPPEKPPRSTQLGGGDWR